MLNLMTIRELPEADRTSVEIALMTLAQTGVLTRQIAIDKNQLLERMDNNGDTEKLAEDIVELRLKNQVLRGIHDLGTQLVKEKST